MVLLSHPAVNSYTRNIALALAEQGILDEFCTTLGWGDGGWGIRHATNSVRREWSRRQVHPTVAERLDRHPWLELGRLIAPCLRLDSLCRHESGPLSVDAVYANLDRHVARRLETRKGVTAVYCGEDGALKTFRAARARGLKCFYDLPIGYWQVARRLFEEEKELMPEFASTLQGREDSPEKLERKREEAELADRIIVCSPFVANTLRESGIAESKISVVPYGGPPPSPSTCLNHDDANGPLKLLFAGSIGQRKGIGYLLKAMHELKGLPIELTVMGTFVGDRSVFRPYESLFRHAPPRAQSSVFELMRQHHVLVLPSIFEGFALVILEAMACGMAVIITPNTGGAEVVRDTVEGFVIPIRSSQAIADKITWMLRHREETQEMRRQATKRAANYSWERFRAGIVQGVTQTVGLPRNSFDCPPPEPTVPSTTSR